MTKTVVLVALAVMAGAAIGHELTPKPDITLRVDTVQVESAALLAQIENLELETGRLRDRLAGRSEVEPEVIYVAADPIPAPEACQLTLRIDDGKLTASPLIMVRDSSGNVAYRAALLDRFDVTRCDDGLSVSPEGRVVCDRPVLGHLGLTGAGGIVGTDPWALAGLEWTPYWRSKLRVLAGARAWPEGLTWELGVSYRFVNIF